MQVPAHCQEAQNHSMKRSTDYLLQASILHRKEFDLAHKCHHLQLLQEEQYDHLSLKHKPQRIYPNLHIFPFQWYHLNHSMDHYKNPYYLEKIHKSERQA